MKKIEIIVRTEKFEDLKDALSKIGINGMTVYSVMGCGNQRGSKEFYRGAEISMNLLHKFKVEIVANDSMVQKIIDSVRTTVKTGNVGDGKIFISEIQNAVRIRTGEVGENAL